MRNGNGRAVDGTGERSNDTAATSTAAPHNQSQSLAFNNQQQLLEIKLNVPSPTWLGLRSRAIVRFHHQQNLAMSHFPLSQQKADYIANTTPLTGNGSTPQHPSYLGLTGEGVGEVSAHAFGCCSTSPSATTSSSTSHHRVTTSLRTSTLPAQSAVISSVKLRFLAQDQSPDKSATSIPLRAKFVFTFYFIGVECEELFC